MTERERFESWARHRWTHPEDFDQRIKAPSKYNNYEVQAAWDAWQERATQPVPSVPEGFSREDLEAVADGLDGYEKTVNVGNVTGGGDDHLESTTAYAARFIRAMLAVPETKP